MIGVEITKVAAALLGTFALGQILTVYRLYRKAHHKSRGLVPGYTVAFFISQVFFLSASLTTIFLEKYPPLTPWTVLVFIAYISTIVALYRLIHALGRDIKNPKNPFYEP